MSPGKALVPALPLALFFAVFVFAPLLLLGYVSLHNDMAIQEPGIAQYVKFLGDAFNLGILGQTLWLAARTTLLALLIGYPLAYLYTLAPRRLQRVLILVIVLPMLTSAVVRTFAWVVILGRQGIINEALLSLAWIESPLMVLPLITALSNIPPSLREASLALGAGRWRTFFKVTAPLSMPGLLAGCLLVFAAAASAFVTQTLVGGGRQMFMPFYIYQQAIQSNNYPFAATIAMLLLVAVLAIVTVMNLIGRRFAGIAHA